MDSIKPNISNGQLWRFVWPFIKLQKWTFLSILVLDLLAWPLDALLWPYILKEVVDLFTQYDAKREAAWSLAFQPMLLALCLVLFVETASRTMGFLMAKAIPKLQSEIRLALFDHVQKHTPRYFNERFAGSLANRISDMTIQIEAILQQLFWPILPALSAVFLGALFLWAIHPLFTLILIIWMTFHLSLCIWFCKTCDEYEQKHGSARSHLLGRIVDSLTNNYAVNLFYRFSEEKQAIAHYQQNEESTNVAAKWVVEKMRCYLSLIYCSAVSLGIFGSLVYLWMHYQITTGELIQVFTTMWSLSMILWGVGSALPLLFQSIGIAKQAYELMLDPEDLGDLPHAKNLKISKGEIIFENVSFNYGKKKLFQNKHVIISGGEKIGLVGFTGAGKSTFINLILRFYPVHNGAILIDGQNIAGVSLKSLRQQIALIPQDPVLFHRSLKDNIRFGNITASDEEVLEAAKLAHCDEFIRVLPQGYDAKVGERGTKLSGGEKQRIAIARAFLRNAPILLLDEATSALDSLTEALIQDSLSKIMQGRTTLVIAHRLSTLAQMDRILVFEKGNIVEEGSHAALIKKKGLYSRMWKTQAGATD